MITNALLIVSHHLLPNWRQYNETIGSRPSFCISNTLRGTCQSVKSGVVMVGRACEWMDTWTSLSLFNLDQEYWQLDYISQGSCLFLVSFSASWPSALVNTPGCVWDMPLVGVLFGGKICLWRRLGQLREEGPSVPGPLHLPNMFWIRSTPPCVCCWILVGGGGGDYVWLWFRSVCHLPSWGLHWPPLSECQANNVKTHNVPI